MFCEKCGQANPDGAQFCEGCGAELQAEVAQENGAAVEAPVEDNGYAAAPAANPIEKFMPMIIGAGAVLLVVILLAAFGIFKSGSLKAVEKYYKATIKGDGAKLYALSVDPYQLEQAIENEVYEDEKEVKEKFKENAEDVKDSLEDHYGKGLKVKVEHKKTTKYKKNDIKKINEYLEERDYPANYVSALHVVKAKVTIKGKEDDDSNTSEYVVAKIKGKWYVNVLPGMYDKDSIEEILDADKDKD